MLTCPACEKTLKETARFCPFCGAQMAVVQSAGEDPYLGKLVAGKYLVDKVLGEGGMGRVYKAVQQPLDKPVVLKVLKTALQGDASLVARFQREARAASRLSHPNSIQVTDFGQMEDGALYIAMEYLEGRDLSQELLAVGPFTQSRLIHVLEQMLSALAEAHEAGVIHRDLKPENVMLVPRRDDPDHVKVLDFGIAKLQDGREGPDGVALTQAGLVCGTPEYMSPEQARGEELDARSDLYAIGVIMYQLATGELPFQADTSIGMVTKHLTEDPVPPRQKRADLSPDLEALILRCMAKGRDERPESAEVLRGMLRGLAEQQRAGTAPYLGAAPVSKAPEPAAPPPSAVAPAPEPTPPRPAHETTEVIGGGQAAPPKRGKGGLVALVLLLPVVAVAGWALSTGRLGTGGGEAQDPDAVVAGDAEAPDAAGEGETAVADAGDADAAKTPEGDTEAAGTDPTPGEEDAADGSVADASDAGEGAEAAAATADAGAGAKTARPAPREGDAAVASARTTERTTPARTTPTKAPVTRETGETGRRPSPGGGGRQPTTTETRRGVTGADDTRRGAAGGAQRDPARARILANLAERHWADGDFEQALGLYEQAARHDPSEPTYQRQIGLAYISLGREARAMAPLRRYVQMAPNASDRPMIEALLRQHGG
jgi:tRNA A-37 threonylcarbamoyl transferase component Bud32